ELRLGDAHCVAGHRRRAAVLDQRLRQDAPGHWTGDVDVLLPGLAGGGDLPAEQLCARTALDPGLDGIALCSRLRAHRGIEIAELGAGAPVADKRARSGIDLVEVEHRGPL